MINKVYELNLELLKKMSQLLIAGFYNDNANEYIAKLDVLSICFQIAELSLCISDKDIIDKYNLYRSKFFRSINNKSSTDLQVKLDYQFHLCEVISVVRLKLGISTLSFKDQLYLFLNTEEVDRILEGQENSIQEVDRILKGFNKDGK